MLEGGCSFFSFGTMWFENTSAMNDSVSRKKTTMLVFFRRENCLQFLLWVVSYEKMVHELRRCNANCAFCYEGSWLARHLICCVDVCSLHKKQWSGSPSQKCEQSLFRSDKVFLLRHCRMYPGMLKRKKFSQKKSHIFCNLYSQVSHRVKMEQTFMEETFLVVRFVTTLKPTPSFTFFFYIIVRYDEC